MKVRFGMTWTVYGTQDIDIPDYIDVNDMDAVRNFVRDEWRDVPLPDDADYVDGSDYLDEDYIEVIDDYGFPYSADDAEVDDDFQIGESEFGIDFILS